jgi:hypothetical protein
MPAWCNSELSRVRDVSQGRPCNAILDCPTAERWSEASCRFVCRKGGEVSAAGETPVCPDCGTTLREIWTHGEYACPVAFETKSRGVLGQSGYKHKVITVWTRSTLQSHRGKR